MRFFSRRFVILNAGLVVVVAGLITAGLFSVFHTASAHPAIRTVSAQVGIVSATVSATGNVSPAQTENVGFAASGTVTEVDVTAGQSVTTGEALAKIDPGPAQAALTAAEDQLSAAEDNLALTRSGGETPPQKAQDAATLSAAQSLVTTDQATLDSDQSQLAKDQAACPGGSGQPAGGSCGAVGADQQAVNQAQNALTQAQNSLTQTQLSIQAKQYVNPATVLQDEAAVTQATETVTQDQKTLAETTLTAPFSGTITGLTGYVGETVSGGGSSAASSASSSSSGSGGGSGAATTGSSSSTTGSGSGSSSSAFLTMADVSQLQVVAGFAEADATKVASGQPATVTLSALTNVSLPGQVTSVSAVSTVVSNVVTYDVTVALTNPPATVKPGMTATVAVVVSSVSNALEVPTSAVTTTGRVSTVTLLKNGKQSTVTVTPGLVGDTTTQILSGLTAGDVVVEPTVTVTGSAAGTGGRTTTGLFGGGLGGGGLGGLGGGGLGGATARSGG